MQTQGINTSLVCWNSRDNLQFVTALDHTLKLWDYRKFDLGCEIQTRELDGLNLRNIGFDPIYGKLLFAQDKDSVKLLKTDDLSLLDTYDKKNISSCQFLPFSECGSPGLVLLPEKSSNFIYLRVDEISNKVRPAQEE